MSLLRAQTRTIRSFLQPRDSLTMKASTPFTSGQILSQNRLARSAGKMQGETSMSHGNHPHLYQQRALAMFARQLHRRSKKGCVWQARHIPNIRGPRSISRRIDPGRRYFLRWRIFARIRRLRLPILRRPFPVLFVPMSKSTPRYEKCASCE